MVSGTLCRDLGQVILRCWPSHSFGARIFYSWLDCLTVLRLVSIPSQQSLRVVNWWRASIHLRFSRINPPVTHPTRWSKSSSSSKMSQESCFFLPLPPLPSGGLVIHFQWTVINVAVGSPTTISKHHGLQLRSLNPLRAFWQRKEVDIAVLQNIILLGIHRALWLKNVQLVKEHKLKYKNNDARTTWCVKCKMILWCGCLVWVMFGAYENRCEIVNNFQTIKVSTRQK